MPLYRTRTDKSMHIHEEVDDQTALSYHGESQIVVVEKYDSELRLWRSWDNLLKIWVADCRTEQVIARVNKIFDLEH